MNEVTAEAMAIKEFIKKNYEPVEDKPGYVWFSKRNFQIIKTETLVKSLEEGQARGLYNLPLGEDLWADHCKTCFHYPEDGNLRSNAICIMCTNPRNSIDHLYYKKKEDSDE